MSPYADIMWRLNVHALVELQKGDKNDHLYNYIRLSDPLWRLVILGLFRALRVVGILITCLLCIVWNCLKRIQEILTATKQVEWSFPISRVKFLSNARMPPVENNSMFQIAHAISCQKAMLSVRVLAACCYTSCTPNFCSMEYMQIKCDFSLLLKGWLHKARVQGQWMLIHFYDLQILWNGLEQWK